MKSVNDIRTLCYNLYIMDWKKDHNITIDDEVAAMKSYLKEYPPECFTEANPPELTFDEYLMERGFNGEIYACYEEFLDNEYCDEEYIESLLTGISGKYLKQYKKDNAALQEEFERATNLIRDLDGLDYE